MLFSRSSLSRHRRLERTKTPATTSLIDLVICRPGGTALTSLLCDDWYLPVGEAEAIGYLIIISSKRELRFGTYSFVSDYGCPHPGMPLCHKQTPSKP